MRKNNNNIYVYLAIENIAVYTKLILIYYVFSVYFHA